MSVVTTSPHPHTFNVCSGLENIIYSSSHFKPQPFPVFSLTNEVNWHSHLIVKLGEALPQLPKVLRDLVITFFHHEYARSASFFVKGMNSLYFAGKPLPEMIPIRSALVISPIRCEGRCFFRLCPTSHFMLIFSSSTAYYGQTPSLHGGGCQALYPSEQPAVFIPIGNRHFHSLALLARYETDPQKCDPESAMLLQTYIHRVDRKEGDLDQYVQDNPQEMATAMETLKKKQQELI